MVSEGTHTHRTPLPQDFCDVLHVVKVRRNVSLHRCKTLNRDESKVFHYGLQCSQVLLGT